MNRLYSSRITVGFLILVALFLGVKVGVAQAALGEMKGWAWSSNVGWMSFNCANTGGGNCATSPYKVMIDDADAVKQYLTGYAWSNNLGWIKFDKTLTGPGGGIASGAYWDGASKVLGWARACNVFASGCAGALKPDYQTGGWNGWIDLGRNTQYGVETATGATQSDGTINTNFNKFAWGDLVMGWIMFNPKTSTPTDVECKGCQPGGGSARVDLTIAAAGSASFSNSLTLTSQPSTVNLKWDTTRVTNCQATALPVVNPGWSGSKTSNPLNIQPGVPVSATDGTTGQTYILSCTDTRTNRPISDSVTVSWSGTPGNLCADPVYAAANPALCIPCITAFRAVGNNETGFRAPRRPPGATLDPIRLGFTRAPGYSGTVNLTTNLGAVLPSVGGLVSPTARLTPAVVAGNESLFDVYFPNRGVTSSTVSSPYALNPVATPGRYVVKLTATPGGNPTQCKADPVDLNVRVVYTEDITAPQGR